MAQFDLQTPALLLRLDPNPFHHGTLGALRSLGRGGVEVHLAVGSAVGPVGRCRFLHRLHVLPHDAAASDEGLEEALCRISDALGTPAVLIPLDDLGAIGVASLAPRLGERFLLPCTAPALPFQVADKEELAALCARAGVPHPTTLVPSDAAEAAGAAEELGLPAVAKWSRPWLLPTGLRSTSLVRTPAESAALYERSAEAGSRLLLQRRLPGGQGTDWFFHGYAGDDGAFLTGGAGRKERSWPLRTGLTAVGTWVANREIEETAARVAAHTGYRGILDLDFRLDTRTGAYHLLDFNPRPGAQFRLFTDDGGLDVVRAQHLHLTGQPVPAPEGGQGRVFVAENYAALSALSGLLARLSPEGRARGAARAAAGDTAGRPAPPPARPKSRPRWRTGSRPRSRGGARRLERAWYAADDPAPFFAMARSWTACCARKALLRAAPSGPARPSASSRPSASPPSPPSPSSPSSAASPGGASRAAASPGGASAPLPAPTRAPGTPPPGAVPVPAPTPPPSPLPATAQAPGRRWAAGGAR